MRAAAVGLFYDTPDTSFSSLCACLQSTPQDGSRTALRHACFQSKQAGIKLSPSTTTDWMFALAPEGHSFNSTTSLKTLLYLPSVFHPLYLPPSPAI